MDVLNAQLVAVLQMLIGKYPVLMAVISIMGILRVLMKPLFTFLQAVADATPTQKDNQLLQEVESSKVVQVLSFVLDWVASVKVGPQAK